MNDQLEGSCCNLVQGTVPTFAQSDWSKARISLKDGWQQDSFELILWLCFVMLVTGLIRATLILQRIMIGKNDVKLKLMSAS
jgi:hypothetical protein